MHFGLWKSVSSCFQIFFIHFGEISSRKTFVNNLIYIVYKKIHPEDIENVSFSAQTSVTLNANWKMLESLLFFLIDTFCSHSLSLFIALPPSLFLSHCFSLASGTEKNCQKVESLCTIYVQVPLRCNDNNQTHVVTIRLLLREFNKWALFSSRCEPEGKVWTK